MVIDGYLARLGLDHPGAPSVEGLFAVHRAQVERIAYTTVDIQRGRPPGIDPYESAARVAATGRGGYCFHLNGGLSVLLAGLGFDVRRHRGMVWTDETRSPFQPYPNHLVLTVHGLPSSANPGGSWMVDAGLGDALHEPAPLRSGPFNQGAFSYALAPAPAISGGWRFTHDARGSFRGMDFEPTLAGPADFAGAHVDLSTSPTSNFVRWLTACRRHTDGYDKLVSCTLRRFTATGESRETAASSGQLRAMLADEFRLSLDDFGADDWDLVWRRAKAAQEEYERGLVD